MKLLPTPAGPTSSTCSCLSRNFREKTASRSRRSRVMDARPVKVLQAAGLLEAGALQPQFNAPVGAAMSWEWAGWSWAFIPALFAGHG